MALKIRVPISVAVLALAWAGCRAPIGTDRVSTRQAYAQVEANALRTGKPSAATLAILHRCDLDRLAARRPDEAVRQLHLKALATGQRDLLFALAELSYVAGDHIRRSGKQWDPSDARDYYLGSAVYSWLYLFGEGRDPAPGAFDRQFRQACDFYNFSLGLALLQHRSTNPVVELRDGRRRLPVGDLELQLVRTAFSSRLEAFDQIQLTDQFQVRGFSVRNRDPGLGAPLLCIRPKDAELGTRPCVAATVFLRGPRSLAQLDSGNPVGLLEVYSTLDDTMTTVNGMPVPVEADLTTYWAHALNQPRLWRVGKLQFLAPAKRIGNQLILHQPYEPGRIPIVLVHGTFSSPVTWAEMANSLMADRVLRQRYQVWSFVYGSGNALIQSIADLRSALTAQVEQLDPAGTNSALRRMVVIGHSQGGLLTKGTAIDSGDRLWRTFSTNRLEDLPMGETQRAELRRQLFLEPLPFVRRVVFIATPHRGSYLSGGFVRQLARWVVSLPGTLVSRMTDWSRLTAGSQAGQFFKGKLPTSLDGMSPENPGLLVIAEIPVVPEIKAHSIIPVLGDGDYRQGRDGVVAYQSAQVDYVESEFIVRSKHSCLNQPATIEEVRRILHEHLRQAE